MIAAQLSRTSTKHRQKLMMMATTRTLAVNALEESLEKAATDPQHRHLFYRHLMESEIYVVSESAPAGDGGGLYLQQWEISQGATTKAVLPFFSSLQNLQRASSGENAEEPIENYAKLECRTFFDLVKGSPTSIVLNPGLPYGKEFFPQEISGLLDGSLLAPEPKTVPEGTQLIMGQPKEYPIQLVDALTELFQERPTVQAAYLAQVYEPDSGEPPNLLIGIQLTTPADTTSDATEAFQAVLQGAIRIQQEVHLEDTTVDFVEVTENNEATINKYLLEKTTPFFSRPNDS